MCTWNTSTPLQSFGECYWSIHGYYSLIVCLFGVITNLINIAVLTKKSMRTPINCILTGIAIADLITMLSYIPFAIHFYLVHGLEATPAKYSYGWTIFMAVHVNLTLTTHTVSIWLGVIMAIMRYVFVRAATPNSKKNMENSSTIIIIVFAYIGSAVLIIPNCIVTGIHEAFSDKYNASTFRLDSLSLSQNETNTMALLNFWVYPVFGKIIPCVLISIFGGFLLHTLRESDRRGSRLKGENHKSHSHRRTTLMLLAVIVMYIISEVPQSILVVLCACVDGFFVDVYLPLSDLIDAVALINSAVNFVMYCTMSQQFRDSLMESLMLVIRVVGEKSKVPWSENGITTPTFV
ncbi:G-protein coupled receptor dmsr-1 [Patella vulgata]|uniref:G-protein coupled receptor dmsr-1 n=1 Tax=Patella vulgata TaxID=6465 RepID=UPI002180463D|nr:G-protein coupled receptor dmsr-1 [Patella vulgata]